jgi:hypothetical protein
MSVPQAYLLLEQLLEAFEYAVLVHAQLKELRLGNWNGYHNQVLEDVMNFREEFQDMHHLVLSMIVKKQKEIWRMIDVLRLS